MQPYLRKSIWTKSAALGFITMILLGNVWIAYFLSGQASQPWIQESASFCLVWITFSGFCMGIKILLHRMMGASNDDSSL